MKLSADTFAMLHRTLSLTDLDSVLTAIEKEPNLSPRWEIEGKNNLDDDWILIDTAKTLELATEKFEKVKQWSGGFYRLTEVNSL